MVEGNGKHNPKHVKAYKKVESKQKKDGTDELGARAARKRIADFVEEAKKEKP